MRGDCLIRKENSSGQELVVLVERLGQASLDNALRLLRDMASINAAQAEKRLNNVMDECAAEYPDRLQSDIDRLANQGRQFRAGIVSEFRKLSSEHVAVDLYLMSPQFGELKIESFQRRLSELQETKHSKYFHYLGKMFRIKSLEFYGEICKIVVEDNSCVHDPLDALIKPQDQPRRNIIRASKDEPSPS